MMRASLLLLSIALCASTAVAQAGHRVALPASKDTCIYSNSPDTSSGRGPITSGTTQRFGTRRGLFAFDVAGRIPAGARILGVQLELSCTATRFRGQRTSLHRALASWDEGSSISTGGTGDTATAGDATWRWRYYMKVAWGKLGGDFVPTPSSSRIVDFPGRYTWPSTPRFVADVQTWLDQPASNHGLFVITEEAGVTAKLWASRESGRAADRPRLVVDFDVQALVEPFGTSCGTQPIQLLPVGLPSIGNAGFALSATGATAHEAFLLLLGLGVASPPLPLPRPGCRLFLAPDAWIQLSAHGPDARGASRIPLPIPALPSLAGATVYAQALAWDGRTNPRSSRALRIRSGR